MKIHEITSYLEEFAPLALQESYDNAGLLIGSQDLEVKKALITLDVTKDVVEEAVSQKCDLIVAHHPLIFKGLKKIDYQSDTGKMIARLIRENIAVYAAHTNLDNVLGGVNGILSEKLGLTNVHILAPKTNTLLKLVVFCPVAHAENVQQAMFDAGAGNIGNYDSCSFNSTGYGTFKASDKANPYVGEAGSLHKEEEVRIETVAPEYLLNKIISSMLAMHPYEEVAYDIFPLANEQQNVGTGIIGELQHESDGTKFLKFVKQQLNAAYIRHTEIIDKPVKKVAVCGGSCSFLIHQAYRAGADIFITADVKYHEFFDYKGKMTIVDAGHYETEQFAKELLYAKLKGKFPNFALQISNTITNPINFL